VDNKLNSASDSEPIQVDLKPEEKKLDSQELLSSKENEKKLASN
jgi:hypothetical protein